MSLLIKVLHVWNQAATASIISKYQKEIGYKTHVITQAKHDPLGAARYYGDEVINENKAFFVIKALVRCKDYDIIHLHDAWFMVHLLNFFFPKKKIIMHYHGSMIRLGMKESRRKTWEKLVNVILVATPDLLKFHYLKKPIYVPNPVDTELFHSVSRKQNGDCYISLKKNQSMTATDRLLKRNGIDVNLKTFPKVDYENFPEILNRFEFVCDVPIVNEHIIPTNSTVGLQAMAMGIKTIQHDFSIKHSLPLEHQPRNVVALLDKIYHTSL